jgi:hypothetical protein
MGIGAVARVIGHGFKRRSYGSGLQQILLLVAHTKCRLEKGLEE